MLKILLILTLIVDFNCSSITQNYEILTEEPTVGTTGGPIKGRAVEFRGSKVYQFLNVPYAEPPIGELRFKKPIAKRSWTNELKTKVWGSHCMQPILPTMNAGYDMSEDCLSLNIFTTSSAFHESTTINRLRPVMVWIHGGGFIFGSANAHQHYDGTSLVALKDIVLVSINYRVGPLGFLYLPEAGVPGNMGLWDQLLALKWVRDNIEKFGGDPNMVTIFGESAGSISVSAHIISPQSKGLFKNAIMQSGSILDIDRWTIENVSSLFLREIQCSSSDKVKCLTDYKTHKYPIAEVLLFWPVYGDEFLPEKPEDLMTNGNFNSEINLMLGTVGNEGAVLSALRNPIIFNPVQPAVFNQKTARHYLKEMFGESTLPFYLKNYLMNEQETDSKAILLNVTDAFGDTMIGCPTYAFGRTYVETTYGKVYSYHQTQKPSTVNLIGFTTQSTWIPASHCNDIPMVFGRPFLEPEGHNVEDALLASLMLEAWVTFARTGKPSNIGQTEWPSWRFDSLDINYPTMVLDGKRLGVIDSTKSDLCLENWPYPRQEGVYWSDPIKPYPKNEHNEF